LLGDLSLLRVGHHMAPIADVVQHESWDMSVTSLSGCMVVVSDVFALNLLGR